MTFLFTPKTAEMTTTGSAFMKGKNIYVEITATKKESFFYPFYVVIKYYSSIQVLLLLLVVCISG